MIYLCGDTHGTYDIKKVNNWYNKNHTKLTEDDVMIQLGDWGAIWHDKHNLRAHKKDLELQVKWSKKKFTLLVVPGNHENYNEIEKLPIIEKFGGKVRVLKPINIYNLSGDYKEIYLLERGEIYTINGLKFLTLGGAMSQDKSMRTTNIDWWEQELWTHEQESNCLDNLEKHSWEVDYVISHTCPTIIGAHLIQKDGKGYLIGKTHDPVAKFFQHLVDSNLSFKMWYFGHFHMDYKIYDFQCCYDKIYTLS